MTAITIKTNPTKDELLSFCRSVEPKRLAERTHLSPDELVQVLWAGMRKVAVIVLVAYQNGQMIGILDAELGSQKRAGVSLITTKSCSPELVRRLRQILPGYTLMATCHGGVLKPALHRFMMRYLDRIAAPKMHSDMYITIWDRNPKAPSMINIVEEDMTALGERLDFLSKDYLKIIYTRAASDLLQTAYGMKFEEAMLGAMRLMFVTNFGEHKFDPKLLA